ncbi:MAG: helix-turn-helix transcriptional regulator [Synergistaceae bacterium]|nr:helix-turn-helix transcriptional regulator [Synergistaceae bacterium]MBR0250664.1 helix-turn-helix transcriptional regulator [Synergistaceae bacterium]
MNLTLGERIRTSRKGKMTQAQLAEAVGVHEITIRRWESGERTPDVKEIQKISQVLNVPIGELLNDSSLEMPPIMMNATRENTSQEKNTNMASITLDNGRRVEAPATPEGLAFLKEVFAMSLSNTSSQLA